MNILRKAESVCPECLEPVPALLEERGGGVYMQKSCPEHGSFSSLVWEGSGESYLSWGGARPLPDRIKGARPLEKACPHSCGLCEAHERGACCVLLETTNRCDMRCPVCFAASGEAPAFDMGLDAVRSEFRRLMDLGGPFNIQLSGGEPTMRDDLPEIIAIGREEGFSFFQLNTNGLRIAREPDYLLALKDAGLSCVYLQFDSFDDSHNVALRGRKMLRERMAAIANCRKASIGCVLVPTVVHGINDGMLGAILSFAMGAMPYVRGVHFQPASVFGRYALPHPQKRLTIPKMLSLIEEQTGAQMLSSDFLPGGAESSYCSFHANYLVEPGKGPVCLSKKGAPPPSSAKSRDAVAENWTLDGLEAGQEAFCCDNGSAVLEGEKTGREEQAGSLCETGALDEFLRQRKLRTLTVSGMLFMDAWTFDADRARQCHIAEASENGLIPFCAHNLTSIEGKSLYRSAHHAKTAY